MEFLKKLDFKSIAIIVLGIALIISFFFGQKSHIDTHADEIKELHAKNVQLLKTNDSLKAVNAKIDQILLAIDKKLSDNAQALASTNKEIQILKAKQNEVPRYVSHLSANGVSNALTDILNSKGSNPR